MKISKKALFYFNGSEIIIDKTIFTIGSAELCDFQVDDIDFLQALIIYDYVSGNFLIQNLTKSNQVTINQNTFDEAILEDGDVLQIESVYLQYVETSKSTILEVRHKNIQKIRHQEAVTMPSSFVAPDDDSVLIDGEICKVHFDDISEVSASNLSSITSIINRDHYIDDFVEEHEEISSEQVEDFLRITSSIGGQILNIDYFPLSELDNIQVYHTKKNHNTFELDTFSADTPALLLESGKTINSQLVDGKRVDYTKDKSFFYGKVLVEIEEIKAPKKLISNHLTPQRKEELKKMAYTFLGIFVPFLILLFFKPDPLEEEEKKMSIIYQKVERLVETENNSSALKKASQNQKNEKNKSQKKVAKKSNETSNEKSKPKNDAQLKAKTFALDLDVNLDSLMDSSDLGLDEPSDIADLDTPVSDINTNTNQDFSGDIQTGDSQIGDIGTDGLGGKKSRGIDKIITETVIMGSMDPELLRKIMRQHLQKFKFCYQQELTFNSDSIKGVMDLNFEIIQGGKTRKISVNGKSASFSKRGVDCVKNVLSKIKFPSPKGGGVVAVRQPLNFAKD